MVTDGPAAVRPRSLLELVVAEVLTAAGTLVAPWWRATRSTRTTSPRTAGRCRRTWSWPAARIRSSTALVSTCTRPRDSCAWRSGWRCGSWCTRRRSRRRSSMWRQQRRAPARKRYPVAARPRPDEDGDRVRQGRDGRESAPCHRRRAVRPGDSPCRVTPAPGWPRPRPTSPAPWWPAARFPHRSTARISRRRAGVIADKRARIARRRGRHIEYALATGLSRRRQSGWITRLDWG